MDVSAYVGIVLVVIPLVLLIFSAFVRYVIKILISVLSGAEHKLLNIAYGSIDRLYMWLKERGDIIHIAFGAFVGNVINRAIDQQSALLMSLATLLTLLYVVYQHFDEGTNRAKDVAVFTGSMSFVVGSHLGIPLFNIG